MLIIKPKYPRKKGGSILKTLVTNPYAKALVVGAASGAAKTYGKRKYDNFINTTNKRGKGIVYQ